MSASAITLIHFLGVVRDNYQAYLLLQREGTLDISPLPTLLYSVVKWDIAFFIRSGICPVVDYYRPSDFEYLKGPLKIDLMDKD